MCLCQVFQVVRHLCFMLIFVQFALLPFASNHPIDSEQTTLNYNIDEDEDYTRDSKTLQTDYGLDNKFDVISSLHAKMMIDSSEDNEDDNPIRRDRRDHSQWHIGWFNWLRPITRAFMPLRGRKAYAQSFVPVRGKKSALVGVVPFRSNSKIHRRSPQNYVYVIRRLRGPIELGLE